MVAQRSAHRRGGWIAWFRVWMWVLLWAVLTSGVEPSQRGPKVDSSVDISEVSRTLLLRPAFCFSFTPEHVRDRSAGVKLCVYQRFFASEDSELRPRPAALVRSQSIHAQSETRTGGHILLGYKAAQHIFSDP